MLYIEGGIGVTPHVGVWIETEDRFSHFAKRRVTPHVGVWIETDATSTMSMVFMVTPHVGVWIETQSPQHFGLPNISHTSCRCVD